MDGTFVTIQRHACYIVFASSVCCVYFLACKVNQHRHNLSLWQSKHENG